MFKGGCICCLFMRLLYRSLRIRSVIIYYIFFMTNRYHVYWLLHYALYTRQDRYNVFDSTYNGIYSIYLTLWIVCWVNNSSSVNDVMSVLLNVMRPSFYFLWKMIHARPQCPFKPNRLNWTSVFAALPLFMKSSWSLSFSRDVPIMIIWLKCIEYWIIPSDPE